ncbi:hypothetical protein VPNG_03887 [Cytospora leucostoma]|uniref:Uncharacterized protein n=1 Tax=Cytospora leucostoma TaxID=1230097 RepID=A0A423XES0_9PEZI|nr:hypothetical protein VPNG_03887 [Cytospora leucostoma]
MSPLSSRNGFNKLMHRDEPRGYGASCDKDAWACLNTTGQFGVIFSIIIVVAVSVWIYWYTVIRPRRERDERVDQDIEMDLGDGRTVIVSSGPYQRTVVFRGARSPSPPPPAYRPPTPGRGPIAPSDMGTSNGLPPSPPPSPRVSRTQIWPPQPGVVPRTPPREPRDPARPSGPPRTRLFQPGMPFQTEQPPMYPPQIIIPGPPPPPPVMMYPQSKQPLYTVLSFHIHHRRSSQFKQEFLHRHQDLTTHDNPGPHRLDMHPPSMTRSPIAAVPCHHQDAALHPISRRATKEDVDTATAAAVTVAQVPAGPQIAHKVVSEVTSSSYSSKSGGSYRSSTSLDSDMLSGLESLLERAGRRKRARETERLQALIDRYDSEEQGAQDWAGVRSHAADTVTEAETAHHVTRESAQRRGTQLGQRNAEQDGTGAEESETERPRRHVTFDRPSLEVLESRVGRPRSPSPPDRNPTRQDIQYGQSRVGRRRRRPSPNERIVERPRAPPPATAESRVGNRRRPSPTREQPATRRGAHAFLGAGESRVGYRSHHRPGEPSRPETSPREAGATYIPPQAPHDGLPLNVPRAPGPPSSTGATCGNGSEASEESSSARPQVRGNFHRDIPTRGRDGPSRHGHEHVRRQRNTPLPEDPDVYDNYDDDDGSAKKGKRGWASKLAAFLPTMTRLATNNPVARAVAEEVAEAVTGREMDIGASNLVRSIGIRTRTRTRASCHPFLFPTLASDERPVAHTNIAGEDRGRQGARTTVTVTVVARARFPRSAQKACSSPSSTPPNISRRSLSGQR